MKTRLILASASPARLRTLRSAGIEADVIVSGVDESTVDCPQPKTLTLTLARLKARAVTDRLGHGQRPATSTVQTSTVQTATGQTSAGRTIVLGCDSALELDGEILGKPGDPAEARRRWLAMRGRNGVLHTGHCLINLDSGRTAEAVASTTVHFAEVTDAEIDAYVATGEPLHVAGAFTIDGIGGPFVERIVGDPGTVIGLSLPLLRRLLGEIGMSITELWSAP